MNTASQSRRVAKVLVRPALWFCACNLLAAALAAQCSNPTQVPNQTDSSGAYSYPDNNALSASSVVVNGSASMTLVAGNCIQLLPGFHATAGTAATTFHAWVEAVPTAVSVSPSSGSGLSQAFTWTVSSPSGGGNIASMQLLINSSFAGSNACYVYYNAASNTLSLANNAGTTWSNAIVAGQTGTVSNSQCTVNGSGSSASVSGNQLALTVSISFQTAFSGAKNDYLFASDNEGLYTGWQQMGTWTVPAGQQYYLTAGVGSSGGGTVSPGSGYYNSGAQVTITATPASGYQFNGFSGSVASSSNPLTVTMNSAMTETANFTQSATQYQLTTKVSPSAAGTVGPSCGSGCMYNSGAGVGITATPNAGYVFSGFSGNVGGRANPLNVTMNSAMSETANFVRPGLALPSTLKGVNYFPRGHAWWSMLYDWYTQDCATSTIPGSCIQGETVSAVVASDIETLHQNGFNMIHLYLWDQDIVASPGYTGPAGPGFLGWDQGGGPKNSPANSLGPNDSSHNQWTALAAFASLAQANGIYLFLEFATAHASNEINGAPPISPGNVGSSYAVWVNQFFDNVASSQDVLVWGVDYGIGQGVSSPFFQAALPQIFSHFQANPYAAGRALIGVDANFMLAGADGVQVGLGTTYQWTWQTAQQEAYEWQQYANPPDLYIFQLWNASAADLQANLECAAGQPNAFCPAPQQQCGSQCASIPFSQMISSEFATGSSWEAAPIGNGIAYYGDQNTPTTTAPGQAQWLADTLCTLSRYSIPNTGYYGLYDSESWWEQYFDFTPQQFAWHGYWGLMSEASGFNTFGANGVKPAWNVMNSSSNCNQPLPPVLALQADATYYTVNDTGKLTYSAANATSLSLNEPPPSGQSAPSSYACDNSATLSSSSLTGSCAFTNITAANTGTITLTGVNDDVDGSQSTSSTTGTGTSVTVGLSPIVNGIVDYTSGQSCNLTLNPSCVLSAGQTDILEIFGAGFNPNGANTVEFANSATQVWFYETDGLYYWDDSRTQINAQLSCSVTAGAWTFYVRSPNSGTPSTGVSINVTAASGCN